MTLRAVISTRDDAVLSALRKAGGFETNAELVRVSLQMLRDVLAHSGTRNALMNSLPRIARSNLNGDLQMAGLHFLPDDETLPWLHTTEQAEAKRRQNAIEWLTQFVSDHRIIEDLHVIVAEQQALVAAREASTEAYQRVIGDLQRKLDKAFVEIGQIDPIVRNRKEFLHLLEETFSVRLGPVSVSVKGFMKICRFAFKKQ